MTVVVHPPILPEAQPLRLRMMARRVLCPNGKTVTMVLFLHLNFDQIPTHVPIITSRNIPQHIPKRFTGADKELEGAEASVYPVAAGQDVLHETVELDGGTRGGTFHGEMGRCRESQIWTTACRNMQERAGKNQGEDSPKQAGSCWFTRHS